MHTHRITRYVRKLPLAPSFVKIHDDLLEELATYFGTSDFGMMIDTIDNQESPYLKLEVFSWIDDEEEDDVEDEDVWPMPKLDDLFESGTYWPWR